MSIVRFSMDTQSENAGGVGMSTGDRDARFGSLAAEDWRGSIWVGSRTTWFVRSGRDAGEIDSVARCNEIFDAVLTEYTTWYHPEGKQGNSD